MIESLHRVAIGDLDHGQAEDDDDETQKHESQTNVAPSAAVVQLMSGAKAHPQPPKP